MEDTQQIPLRCWRSCRLCCFPRFQDSFARIPFAAPSSPTLAAVVITHLAFKAYQSIYLAIRGSSSPSNALRPRRTPTFVSQSVRNCR